mmetsp:Transcript_12990/g.36526  ORF Transcript_12990/g.36526 Transcript_12990/m.36526 type:complete len:274 (-) Transcript_12990:544-1365(-)
MEKLQSCITWTKKSSKGWRVFTEVCHKYSERVKAFTTPVKTRFTSTWRMLQGLLNMKKIITYIYGEHPETPHLRLRCPTPVDWSVAATICKELHYPCKVVVQAQSNGHWILSDVIYRVAQLYLHMKNALRNVDEEGSSGDEDLGDCGPSSLSEDIAKVKEIMREHIMSQLSPAVQPLTTFLPIRAHEVMAIQLDPRYCKGGIFVEMNDIAEAKVLMKRYTTEILVPTLISVKDMIARKTAAQNSASPDLAAATSVEEAVDALSDSEDEGNTAP